MPDIKAANFVGNLRGYFSPCYPTGQIIIKSCPSTDQTPADIDKSFENGKLSTKYRQILPYCVSILYGSHVKGREAPPFNQTIQHVTKLTMPL